MKGAPRTVTTRACLYALLLDQHAAITRGEDPAKIHGAEVAELSPAAKDMCAWYWLGVTVERESQVEGFDYSMAHPVPRPSELVELLHAAPPPRMPDQAAASAAEGPFPEPSFMAHRLKVAEQARDDWRGVAIALMVLVALFMLGTLTYDGSATRVDPYQSGVTSGVTNGGSWK